MNASFRRLEPGEVDPELLLLGASTGSLAWGCAWVGSGLPLPRCAFHAMTGCPCPTCGATRCVAALLHGRVGEAMGWNPMVFLGLAAMALLTVYLGVVVLAGLPRVRVMFTGNEACFFQWAFVVVAAANWAYEIRRGV